MGDSSKNAIKLSESAMLINHDVRIGILEEKVLRHVEKLESNDKEIHKMQREDKEDLTKRIEKVEDKVVDIDKREVVLNAKILLIFGAESIVISVLVQLVFFLLGRSHG